MASHSAAASASAAASNGARAAEPRGRIFLALSAVADILRSIPQAAQAASDYRTLSDLSDAALARRGLKRDDLPRFVFDVHFAQHR